MGGPSSPWLSIVAFSSNGPYQARFGDDRGSVELRAEREPRGRRRGRGGAKDGAEDGHLGPLHDWECGIGAAYLPINSSN